MASVSEMPYRVICLEMGAGLATTELVSASGIKYKNRRTKQYMTFEQDTLQRVIEARSRVHAATQSQDIAALGPAEGALRMGLGNLFALAEAYPDLKANASFQQLQSRISALEDSIADRREFYNESVNVNNVRIEQVPDVIVARTFGFGPFKLLEFTAEQTRDVDMKQLFT